RSRSHAWGPILVRQAPRTTEGRCRLLKTKRGPSMPGHPRLAISKQSNGTVPRIPDDTSSARFREQLAQRAPRAEAFLREQAGALKPSEHFAEDISRKLGPESPAAPPPATPVAAPQNSGTSERVGRAAPLSG